MIRKARKEDCPELYDLIHEIFVDMELPLLDLLDPDVLKAAVVRAMHEDVYRFSYRNGLVYEEADEILGCCFGYPGATEPIIDAALRTAFKEMRVTAPRLFPDSETFAGEWYLDSIVTKQSARGKGVAHQLLQALPTLASVAGETVIGLNCEKDNLQAKKLYEKVGFRTVSERILSGHVYDHMQWKFRETS
ncbi:acetyltransferase (GNAT) family protein [Trichococcus patagoniensis]|uniref:Acetyltransferase (GNAT) family protein n=1 Tax=Trichococcus patagoniensis TaxID=382641 RepID=A0A2T5INZ4_9LACT|nr:GNAT family N-acetyltransferase [Trichococcus patagoniensis]PTQ85500.1 acetyltransferase (GNAT) family protein [Trichococcus patagoniensis]